MPLLLIIAAAFLLPSSAADQPCTQRRDTAIATAIALRNEGQGAASLACLQQAITVHPDDVVLLTDAGIQAHAIKNLSAAASALERALQLAPENPIALYAMARVQIDRNLPIQAEAFLRSYLKQRPADASAHYGLGHLLQMQQRPQEATLEFQQSIRLQPLQTESYYQLGEIALDDHRDAEAKTFFATALARMPAHGGALTGTGILLYREREFSHARTVLSQAIAASPDYQPAHYYLGLTLARLGQKAESDAELETAKRLITEQQAKSAPIGRAVGPPLP